MDKFFYVGKAVVVFKLMDGLYASGSGDAGTVSLDVDPV